MRAMEFVWQTSKHQHRNEKSVIKQPLVTLPTLNQHDSLSKESVVKSNDSASATLQKRFFW
jgi:hypothetical protein